MKISAEITQHDKFQIEIKTVCPIRKHQRVNDYYVDAFFFLPRNLAINSHTYTGREFYNDFSEYIRFKTPSVSLEKLAAPGNSVLQRLSDSIGGLPASKEEFSLRLKMFCSIARSALRDTATRLEALQPDDQGVALLDYLNWAQALLANFRDLRRRLLLQPEALELYDLVDEYLSIALNGRLYRLWNRFSPLAGFERQCAMIAEVTHGEIEYRKKRGCPSIPDEHNDNSEMLYRESALKKAMASILFLKVATRKDGVFVENMLLALSAAVAMIFVTAISFAWKGLFLEEFSLSFFVVWVIAYMFKDRIKSQLQLFCLNKRSRYAYDYRQKVFDGFGNEIGICREGFRHCDGSDLNETITAVRNRTTLSRLEDGSQNENVIVYRKKFELFGDACKNIFREFDVNGVVNIYRINVLHWLYKMDNPKRLIYCSDGKTVRPLKAHRDYHVNIILRFGEKGGEEQYVRCRLVLCRNGIRRLETFPHAGESEK